ncbi:uncharacterized protein EI97DRAFT_462842 [Westerdykella ornata]|uniref:Uncharacterized protein n=1 Tax=Westerdykella ornata TaxID=318751 RepID=A0A6A6J635_WESOR|nr:uncharacterized protein EI97DRAFT_462842 [Westerdykella ornata]KAF2271428.1 hypothetical protein EI97DRAFT_462842 [Westerdykella ornata]
MPPKKKTSKAAMKTKDEGQDTVPAEIGEAENSSNLPVNLKSTTQLQGVSKNTRRRNNVDEGVPVTAVMGLNETDLEDVPLDDTPLRGGLAMLRRGRRAFSVVDSPLIPQTTPRRNPSRNTRNRVLDYGSTPYKKRAPLPTIMSPGNLEKAGNTTDSPEELAAKIKNMYLGESVGKRRGRSRKQLSDFELQAIGRAPASTKGKGKQKASSESEEYDFANDAMVGDTVSDSEPEEIRVLNDEEKKLQGMILDFTSKLSWSKGNLWDIEVNDVEVIRKEISRCEGSPYSEQREETREHVAILKRMLEILELAIRLKEASADFRNRIKKIGLKWDVSG